MTATSSSSPQLAARGHAVPDHVAQRAIRSDAALTQALVPRLNKYIPHYPHPPQAAFLLLNYIREVFYGGAAGGGKSDALLMGALQYVDIPNYSALLLRNTFSDLSLPDAIMERSKQWLSDSDAHWVDKEHTWVFPSGARLVFGYIEHESDKYRYKSAAFQYIGFDELTHFTETQYRFLFSRLRRLAGSSVPIRMRSASNPGGPGHEWVKRRFIDPHTARGRVFVPAKLEDNPSLDQAEYEETLAELDPITRAQMRAGNWEARPEGGLFSRKTFEVVDAAPPGLRTLRCWDLAGTDGSLDPRADYTVGIKIGWDTLGSRDFYVLDMVRAQLPPDKVEALVRQVAAFDQRSTAIRILRDPGQAGVAQVDHYARTVLPGYDLRGVPNNRQKELNWAPFQAAAARGSVKVVRAPWLLDFFDELEAAPYGEHDDIVDAAAHAHMQVTMAAKQVQVIHAPGARRTA